MFNLKKLEDFISKKECTLLGVGPMSKNCVDAAIELANDFDVPLMIIASKDKKKNLILGRDHGGPWQNDSEKEQKIDFKNAMENAKKSFYVDIKSGFKFIHIDPSQDIFKKISVDEVLNRVFELYDFCHSTAKELNKEIFFEVSTWEDGGAVNSVEEVDYVISKLNKFCEERKFSKPYFFVVRTGNHVMEMQNIGTFENMFKNNLEPNEKQKVLKNIENCNKHNIKIKEHNADYLSDDILKIHPKLGIHASNVAPEFGTTETKALLNILEKNNLTNEKEKFIELCFNSEKWKKWMLPKTQSGKLEKAIISGHYNFSSQEFLELKKQIENKINDIDNLDNYLKEEVKKSIFRYMKSLNLVS